MMKKLIIILLLTPLSVLGNDISVSDITWNKATNEVTFNLSWKNGWKNDRNHDAAWVFLKVKSADSYQHVKLSNKGHTVRSQNNSPQSRAVVPSDHVGSFIEPTSQYRGNIHLNVTLKLDMGSLGGINANASIEVFALEMVYIPEGGFTLGDPDPLALTFASFYKSDDQGNPNGLFKIDSEDQVIEVGPTAGNLYHKSGRQPQYTGDRTGTVPSTFPKGVQPYYMMKYETSQGFYTSFLNSLPSDLAKSLSPHKTEKYYEGRGSIQLVSGTYKTENPDRPCNYITWDDGAALADWAGLRPMTELEFTKAARGTETPLAHEFPWGTDNTTGLARFVDLDDNLKLRDGKKEGGLTNDTRHVYGASYYWVMDLAGSLWEKCVTIGHPIGRNFKGTHGDGIISDNGRATNEDWPKGIAEEGGYGYRGGGYYQHDMKFGDFNPHSPIAYRPYGSWAGGKRSIAYSQRYVRTAPEN